MCDNIESLAIVATPETTGVTAFVQEACSQVDVLGSFHRSSKLANSQISLQSLTDYFSRPRQFANGTIPITRSNIFSTITNWSVLSSYFPNIGDRLQGVYGVKFKIVYTLQVAATPFHQGLLALAWQYGDINGGYNRGSQPAAITNLPHVRLDLSVDTMVQLSVPFMSPLEFIPLFPSTPLTTTVLGAVSLCTLGGVPVVAGMNSATYKVYVHLEDMEFFGAAPYSGSFIATQGGLDLEQKARPFSAQVGTISSALRMVARGVPSLAGISSGVAWYTDAISGTLKSFGFSKPTVMDPMMRMMKTSTALEQNVDFPTPVSVVGPLASNTLQVDSNFGNSEVDEMALAYVLSQPSQVNYGALTSALTSGTALYTSLVSPGNMWYRAGSSVPYCNVNAPLTLKGAAANSFLPSSLFNACSYFRSWKGDIIFRFTFIKTKMHGGRILATFTPYTFGVANEAITDTYNNSTGPEIVPNVQPFGQSLMMDLRDSNVFEFRVPYVSPTPFTNFNDCVGAMTLTVMDPLQVSSVVSSTVNFMVEAWGAPNFEVAIPRGVLYPTHVAGNIRTQSGVELVSASTPDVVSKYTIGEKINSLKQLIMIPEVAAVSIGATSFYRSLVFPWFFQPGIPTTSPTPVAYGPPEHAFSYGGNISKCYAFVRGSTDLHVYSAGSNTLFEFYAVPTTGGTQAASGGTLVNASASNLPTVLSTDSASIHVRYPAYQRFARLWSSALDIYGWSFLINPLPSTSNTLCLPAAFPYMRAINNGTVNVTYLSRNAGDDAMCSMYQGPCPLYLPNAGTTSTTYDKTVPY